MANDQRIGIIGAAGRMGQMNIRQVTETEGCIIAGATEGPGNPALGKDAGELAGVGALGVALTDDAAAMIANVDAVIDFTVPEATVETARLAAQAGAALIAGTTGLTPEQEEEIVKAARHIPVVRAANMSVGVTLLAALTEQVASTLGIDYDIEMSGGLKSMLFGGEGIFLATLSGTGSVWIQSLPFNRLLDRIVAAMPVPGSKNDKDD